MIKDHVITSYFTGRGAEEDALLVTHLVLLLVTLLFLSPPFLFKANRDHDLVTHVPPLCITSMLIGAVQHHKHHPPLRCPEELSHHWLLCVLLPPAYVLLVSLNAYSKYPFNFFFKRSFVCFAFICFHLLFLVHAERSFARSKRKS